MGRAGRQTARHADGHSDGGTFSFRDGGTDASPTAARQPGTEVDRVEDGYLGESLDGKHEKFMALSLGSGQHVVGGPGPRLTDSMGVPWTAA